MHQQLEVEVFPEEVFPEAEGDIYPEVELLGQFDIQGDVEAEVGVKSQMLEIEACLSFTFRARKKGNVSSMVKFSARWQCTD